MEHLLFARPCANVERRDSCPAQGALVSGTEQQASVSAPWRGDYRNRHNLLGGETPHLEAGDEKERLGQWHKKGRNATGPVEGPVHRDKRTKAWGYEKGERGAGFARGSV